MLLQPGVAHYPVQFPQNSEALTKDRDCSQQAAWLHQSWFGQQDRSVVRVSAIVQLCSEKGSRYVWFLSAPVAWSTYKGLRRKRSFPVKVSVEWIMECVFGTLGSMRWNSVNDLHKRVANQSVKSLPCPRAGWWSRLSCQEPFNPLFSGCKIRLCESESPMKTKENSPQMSLC